MLIDIKADEIRKQDYFGVKSEIAEKYLTMLKAHIIYVREAGKKLGISSPQLISHDNSKWSQSEFSGYARHLQGGGAPDEFSKAWLHHIHYNPHHWQHWIFPNGYTPKGSKVENGVVEMPYHHALEMIADWMGSEMANQNRWDMSEWLSKNIPKIRVHSSTAQYLGSVLSGLGYSDIINVYDFAS